MIRLLIGFLLAVTAANATTIVLDNTTSLDDGSLFTTGMTYYATFQMDGGDISDSSASIGNIGLGGGSPIPPSVTDLDFGIYSAGPDPAATNGIFQPNGTLSLTLTPASSFSLYSQQFVAGAAFQFDVSLTGTYDGGIPDSFSFQLYSADFSTLLYEQDLDILDTTPATAPEPSTGVLDVAAVFLLAAASMLRKGRTRKLRSGSVSGL